MPVRTYPEDYFQNINKDNMFLYFAIMISAMFITIGIILGALIVSLAGGKHAS